MFSISKNVLDKNATIFYYLLIFTFLLVSKIDSRRISKECLQCDRNPSFSFFWKIKRSKPSPPSYFFGTIHAPYTKVWNYVSSKAKSAFRSSHNIIFELDLMNAETLLSLTQCQLLPPGIRLSDTIPIELYHRLQRHLKYVKYKIPLWMTQEQKSRGLHANALFTAITLHWERKRPIWVLIMLNSLTANDIKSKGITVLDSFFYQKAKKLKKSIGSVENANEQCKTLNYLNTTQVLYALNQTLIQHETIRRGIIQSNHTIDDMIRHYNCGNLNVALFNEDSTNIPVLENHSSSLIEPQEMEIAKNIENYFRSEIILKRNKRMSQRVLELLNSKPKESLFFIFGAGHFLGNDSIIELMKAHNGLEIVHIDDTQHKQSLICDPSKIVPTINSSETSSSKRIMNNEDEDDHQQQQTLIYPISLESFYRLPYSNPSWYQSLSSHPSLSLSSSDIAKYYQNSFDNSNNNHNTYLWQQMQTIKNHHAGKNYWSSLPSYSRPLTLQTLQPATISSYPIIEVMNQSNQYYHHYRLPYVYNDLLSSHNTLNNQKNQDFDVSSSGGGHSQQYADNGKLVSGLFAAAASNLRQNVSYMNDDDHISSSSQTLLATNQHYFLMICLFLSLVCINFSTD